jgi:hypothetical protein
MEKQQGIFVETWPHDKIVALKVDPIMFALSAIFLYKDFIYRKIDIHTIIV